MAIGDITGRSIERLQKFISTLEALSERKEFILDQEPVKIEARDMLMKISHEMRIMNSMLGRDRDAHHSIINRTLFCSITEYDLVPIPVSKKSSLISFNLH